MTRNNKQIWRLAEWLWYNIVYGEYSDEDEFNSWKEVMETEYFYTRNFFYDKAAELLKKLNNNEFTGEDNHES